MTRFELLMDDIRDSIILCNSNKKVFLPAIIGGLASFALVIVFIIIMVFSAIGGAVGAAFGDWIILAIMLTVGILFFTLIVAAVTLVFDIGTIGLVKGLLDNGKYDFSHFKDSLRRYYLRGFGTTIGFTLIMILIMLILLIPILLYLFTVGILSGGWAMILLTVWVQALIGFWLVIMVETDSGGFESIGENLRFGSKNIKILMLVFFIFSMLAAGLPAYFGFVGMLLSFAVAAIVNTVLKMVLIMTYRRYTEAS